MVGFPGWAYPRINPSISLRSHGPTLIGGLKSHHGWSPMPLTAGSATGSNCKRRESGPWYSRMDLESCLSTFQLWPPNGKASRSLGMLTVRCQTMWKHQTVMFQTPMGRDPVPPTIMILHKGRSLGLPFILHRLGAQHWADRPDTCSSNHCLMIKTISNCCYFSE